MKTEFEFNGHKIAFVMDYTGTMVSATQLAKASDKKVDNFERTQIYKYIVDELKITPEFISKVQLTSLTSEGCDNTDFEKKLNDSIRTASKHKEQGTFYCEELALAFAMWISPALHVWVLMHLSKLVFGPNAHAVRTAVVELPDAWNNKVNFERRVKEIYNDEVDNALVKKRADLQYELDQIDFQTAQLRDKLFAPELFDPIEKIARNLRNLTLKRQTIQKEINALTIEINKVYDDPELALAIEQKEKWQAKCSELSNVLRGKVSKKK